MSYGFRDFFAIDDIEINIPRKWIEFQGKTILDLVDELNIKFKDIEIKDNGLKCTVDKMYKNKLEYLQWRLNSHRETINKLEDIIK